MTPLQVKMLLHHYTTPTPYGEHEPQHAASDAVQEQRRALLDGELIKPTTVHKVYECTERGKALVEYICNLPLPEKKWIMPDMER